MTSRFLLVNPRSGAGSGGPELLAEARRLGIETHLLEPGEDAAGIAREAGAEVLGVAGGDGSLAAVAAVALEHGVPFVCVPFGTRNHFARDVGLDRNEPVAALAAFEGDERRVDVGRANDRVFLNNVSFGAYEVLVRRGWRHALDYLRLRHHYVVEGERVRARVLLVANNAYSVTGARDRLDDGLLHVYTPGGELRSGRRVVVESSSGRVAIDGESVTLEAPVELAIEPRALRLLLPRPLA